MSDDGPRISRTDQRRAAGGWDGDFSEGQKDAFHSLSASMSFVGVCIMLLGMLLGVFAIGAAYSGFVANGAGIGVLAAAYVPMAWWTMSAGRSLSALVRTRGGDVGHLMDAVVQLRRLFGFARGVIIVQAILIAAAAGALVWCTFVVENRGRCWGGLGW